MPSGMQVASWRDLVTSDGHVFRVPATAIEPLSVKSFGAVGDGQADDTGAVGRAKAAAKAYGGTILFPAGTYRGQLSFENGPYHVVGEGGRAQANSTGEYTRAASRLVSSADGNIVTFTDTSKSSIEGQHSSLRDIAIEGSGAGVSQNGLVVDNRGFSATNVEIAKCGNDGVQIGDCVSGYFANCSSFRNGRHGWLLDQTLGSGAGAAVTDTTFVGCSANANGSNGWRLRGTVWGCRWFGGDIESNTGYGIFLLASVGSNAPRFNRFYEMWDESNVGGSIRFDDGSVSDNTVSYVRFSSGSASHSNANDHNTVSGTNLSATGLAQRPLTQLVAISTRGGLSSSDLDWMPFRDRDDGGDGVTRHRAIYLTKGLTVGAGDIVSNLSIPPTVVDGVLTPNNVGWTSRNAANSANKQLFVLGTDDKVHIDGNGAGIIMGAGGALSITGSRGGNAALASLLTQLASLGFIVDNTVA